MPRVGHSVTRMSGSVFLFGGQKLYPSSGGYDGILDDLYMGAIPQPGVINWHCLKQPSDPPVAGSSGVAVEESKASFKEEAKGEDLEGDFAAPSVAAPKAADPKMPPHRAWHAAT